MAFARNASDIDAPVGTSGDDTTHWELFDALTGGNSLFRKTVVGNPAALGANQFFRVEAGDLEFEIPAGSTGGTNAGAMKAVRGLLSGTTYFMLFAGASALLTNRISLGSTDFTYSNT